MCETALRARVLMLKGGKGLRREMLLIRLIKAGILICLAMGLSSFYVKRWLLCLPSFGGALLLLFFYFAERLYLTARLYSLSGDITEEPCRFMRFSLVLRYALFSALQGTVKFMWLNFFLMPSRFVGLIILRTLSETGNIQRVMLFALMGAFIALSVAGWGFYFYLSGRYFQGELLFVRCPVQNAAEILKSSALLSAKSLGGIMLFRIRNAFLRGGVYGRMKGALYASDLFCDRKFYKKYGILRPLTFPGHF